MKSINIGIIGVGTVGSGVVEILQKQSALLQKRVGVSLNIYKVYTRRPHTLKKYGFKKDQIAPSWESIVRDPKTDIVVELIGGTTIAKQIVLQSLVHKKAVVTANKALLSEHGIEILSQAHAQKQDLCFEAAVGGGIPVLRAFREGFSANQILSLFAIINGTCNYILSEMEEKKLPFDQVLSIAQQLGYAEKDPTFDIDGIDAAHKLSILIALAFGSSIPPSQIQTVGIRPITLFDIECAERFGFKIRLLASAQKVAKGIQARVHPYMVPHSNPLSAVREAYNAILVEGDYVGRSLLYGKGAGKNPTASAVVGDLVEIARNKCAGVAALVPPYGVPTQRIEKLKLLDEFESEYYLRFQVTDQPGVLAKITSILGQQQMSIAAVYQDIQQIGKTVPIVILTHRASEKKLKKALKKIDQLKVVKDETLMIPIVSEK